MKILETIGASFEKDVIEKNFSRREALTKGLGLGLKAALISIPFGVFEALNNKAMAGPTNGDIVSVLNFALTLEYLESTFYSTGLSTNGLIPSSDQTVMAQISKHETAHVALLKQTITSLSGTPVTMPTFDFTAGGTYSTVFSNYQTFLALANAFEDTGVRAYKGAAPSLLGAGAVLTAALDIHSVEARHAAEVRKLRGLKGWISNADANGLPTAIYASEDNTTQLNIDVTTTTSAPAVNVTEAFDEPLSSSAVLSIVAPFLPS